MYAAICVYMLHTDFEFMKKDLKAVYKKTEESTPSKYLIKGRNVMLMPTRDAYQFSLDLLAMLFPRDELGLKLCFVNSKSKKPPLDQTKVLITVLLICLYDDHIFSD